MDYNSYYKRLGELFRKTKAGDEIVLVGWGFDRNQRLDNVRMTSTPLPAFGTPHAPAPTVEQQMSLEHHLQRAIRDGVQVRLLVTGNNQYQPAENREIVPALNAYKPDTAKTDSQLLPGKTHHQKAVYVNTRSEEGGPFLFIGGMDVTSKRTGWLDLQLEIAGSGATLGLQTLNERWESAHGRDYKTSRMSTPPGRDTYVQFVRSYGDSTKTKYGGQRKYNEDSSYFKILQKAIGMANGSFTSRISSSTRPMVSTSHSSRQSTRAPSWWWSRTSVVCRRGIGRGW